MPIKPPLIALAGVILLNVLPGSADNFGYLGGSVALLIQVHDVGAGAVNAVVGNGADYGV